jgi:hypothetical protein
LIFGEGVDVDVGHECGKESLKDPAAFIWVFVVRTHRILEATHSRRRKVSLAPPRGDPEIPKCAGGLLVSI